MLCFWRSHPAVSSLSCMWNQDGPLQLGRTQDGPPLAHGEDGVPALQRRFGEETCSRKSRSLMCRLKLDFHKYVTGEFSCSGVSPSRVRQRHTWAGCAHNTCASQKHRGVSFLPNLNVNFNCQERSNGCCCVSCSGTLPPQRLIFPSHENKNLALKKVSLENKTQPFKTVFFFVFSCVLGCFLHVTLVEYVTPPKKT